MSINPTTNNINTLGIKQNVKKSNNEPSVSKSFIPKNVVNGAVFGVGAGIGDAIATLFSLKKEVKSALIKFKDANYEIKKEMIKNLHENGIRVKDYKKYAKGILSGSALPMMMLKRGLMFATLLGLLGFGVDVYLKNKEKKS